MQSGGNRFLPANLLNSAVPNYLGSKERKRTIDFLSRMVGAFSIDGDVASWSKEQSLDVKNLIKIYKKIRHLLVHDFHPLTPQPSNPNEGEVISFVSEDKGECVIFAFRMPNEPMNRRVKLRGILPHMDYYVRDLLNPGKPTNLVKGDALMREGLELDLTPDCALYYLSIKGGDL
jgi:alpha-galactosidase